MNEVARYSPSGIMGPGGGVSGETTRDAFTLLSVTGASGGMATAQWHNY